MKRIVFAIALVASSVQAQELPPPAATTSRYYVEAGAWYSSLSRDYSDWRGAELRIQYISRRATPFLIVSTQTRREGTQQNIVLGSYLTWSDRYYSIVSVSHAPEGTAELYPRTRLDATLFGSVPSVRGLVLSAGATGFFGSNNSGGQILSAGSLYYRGRTISSATARLNRDRRSGATSHSFQAGSQFGQQRKSWIGGSVAYGTEAYEVVAAVPFDARFKGVSASLFWQQWLKPRYGFRARYDYEHKFTAYVRNGIALSWFLDL